MKDAAKVVTEITFYFSALQNINLLFFIMFVSWQIPIACLQNFRARFRKMYTEWLLLTAEWCIFSYILLHIKCLITRIRLQSADHKKHEIQISHVFCIFPYFSEIFRNFPGNFPEIFRNIIFRKIYITTGMLYGWTISSTGMESGQGNFYLCNQHLLHYLWNL